MNDNFGLFDGYENFDYYAYESAATAGIAIIGIILLISCAISIAIYLFQAIGLYKMGKRLNISAPALAFFPVVNLYVLGRVAQEPVDGKKRLPYGWILLGLNVGTSLISLSSIMGTVRAIIQFGERSDIEDLLEAFVMSYMAKSFLSAAASIAYTVFYYIAIYYLFKNFNPENATLFTVLSIFFGFLTPFFIFASRNKPIGGENAGRFGQGYNGYYGGFAPNQSNGYNQGYNTPNFNQSYNNPNFNQGYNGGYNPSYGNQGFPPYTPPAQPENPQQPPQNPNGQ
ncbi:MAG: hypothetical protein IJC32_05870 [Clostridia bacterium]|nr:hypothetical protein [Clostridia bacterium]